ncbi:MAG: hypothetical protein AAF431_04690 [Pseudomonadota bacterium]
MAFACDKSTCDECAQEAEFTWNPSVEATTPRLSRFYEMADLIDAAFQKGDFEQAASLIEENLGLASVYRCNWNYGNAIHDSNRILGFIALENDDIPAAANYLISAGKTTGSPQLNSFGPKMDLAQELLLEDEVDAVKTYLLDVKRFWSGNEQQIDDWIEKIDQGQQVQLDRYQISTRGLLIMAFTYAWPLILTFFFWLRIKRNLSDNWSFALASVVLGFIATMLGGRLMGSTMVGLTEMLSSQLVVPALMISGLLMQFGLPFLVIFLLARFYQRNSSQTV